MLRRPRLPLYGGGCGFQRPDGCEGGDGMLVDHLLLAVTDQNHHKAVVTGDHTTELKPIHQEQRYGNLVPAAFLQDGVLQIHVF